MNPGMSMEDTHVLRKTADVNEGNKDVRKGQKNQTRHRYHYETGKISAKCTHRSTKDGRKEYVWESFMFLIFMKSYTKQRGSDASEIM